MTGIPTKMDVASLPANKDVASLKKEAEKLAGTIKNYLEKARAKYDRANARRENEHSDDDELPHVEDFDRLRGAIAELEGVVRRLEAGNLTAKSFEDAQSKIVHWEEQLAECEEV